MLKQFTPNVSIVIPVYNGSNYVREAIDSALSQTYKNIEIIVVNDGSTDDTDEICKSYGNKIRYFKKENGGVSTALNKGIEEMKGEYFSWLSHDDVYYPEKIERQIEILSELADYEDIILYCDFEMIDEKGETIVKVRNDHDMLMKKPEYALLRACVNGITLLIPKKAFEEYGYFDENLRCVQDYVMWREMMKTYKFLHIGEILTKTRIHSLQDTKKNPSCTKEGNLLWIDMIKSITRKDRIRLEGTEYKFYEELVKFMKSTTPYPAAIAFAEERRDSVPIIDKARYLINKQGFFVTLENYLRKKIKR